MDASRPEVHCWDLVKMLQQLESGFSVRGRDAVRTWHSLGSRQGTCGVAPAAVGWKVPSEQGRFRPVTELYKVPINLLLPLNASSMIGLVPLNALPLDAFSI